MSGLIGVVADYDPVNATHRATDDALVHLPGSLQFEWLATDEVDDGAGLARYGGIFVGPASPYRSMDGALTAIGFARELGVPLVGT